MMMQAMGGGGRGGRGGRGGGGGMGGGMGGGQNNRADQENRISIGVNNHTNTLIVAAVDRPVRRDSNNSWPNWMRQMPSSTKRCR